MKCRFFLWAVVIAIPFLTNAQEVSELTVKMGKSKVPAYVAESKYDKKLVADAIKQLLSADNLKRPRRKNKYYLYRGAVIKDISPAQMDYYYRVQKRKKRAKLLFVASMGYDNYVTTEKDPTLSEHIKTYLGRLDEAIAHTLEVRAKEAELQATKEQVQKREAELKDAEKQQKQKSAELDKLKK